MDDKIYIKEIAANHLMGRFNPTGGFLRAWNKERNGEKTTGWTIIDTMMNLPILYWASEEYDDPRFKDVTIKHADNTMLNHIRPDGSVRHIVKHDPVTVEIVGEAAGQGYEIGSAWSRGQAWDNIRLRSQLYSYGKEEYWILPKRLHIILLLVYVRIGCQGRILEHRMRGYMMQVLALQ